MVEGQMNYTLMQSLELISLIKTAIALWNQDDITASTSKFYISLSVLSGRKWQQIEDKIIENVQELLLPESLKKKLSDIIKPIGFEILKWRNGHEDIIPWTTDTRLVKKILNNIYWTPEGTIDRKKTAEALIRDENLGITERYKLACTYCFKNDIMTLLNKFPVGHRTDFYQKKGPIVDITQQELVVFWTYYVKGEVTRINDVIERKWQGCTPYQYAFECAASDGNKVATEYFFQKLTSEEQEESLVRAAAYACCIYVDYYFVAGVDHQGVLCFLLSQMNEEQQVEVFENYPLQVLRCFLYWPLQSFFMEMAKRMWAFLPEKMYDHLLRLIVSKVKDGFKDYDYQKLIREFWQESPRTHKEYVIAEFTSGSLLKDLLEIKDKENLKLILENVTFPDREKIIFSYNGKYACEKLLYNDELDILEFFVQECISSKDLMIKFRGQFGRNVIRYRPKKKVEIVKDKWNKFYQIINALMQKDDKRRDLEERNIRPAKRLCSLTIK